jgi:starch synthase
VLGAGDYWCESELYELQRKLPNFRVHIGYSEELSHLIEAGSDFFLMPSRYEPCGLNQMYSLLYGTLPIVRRTGGLADTVENYNETTGEGTGFMCENLTPQSVFDTIGWAVYAWYNKKEHIQAMRKRGITQKLGWNIAAKKYITVYTQAREKI